MAVQFPIEPTGETHLSELGGCIDSLVTRPAQTRDGRHDDDVAVAGDRCGSSNEVCELLGHHRPSDRERGREQSLQGLGRAARGGERVDRRRVLALAVGLCSVAWAGCGADRCSIDEHNETLLTGEMRERTTALRDSIVAGEIVVPFETGRR